MMPSALLPVVYEKLHGHFQLPSERVGHSLQSFVYGAHLRLVGQATTTVPISRWRWLNSIPIGPSVIVLLFIVAPPTEK